MRESVGIPVLLNHTELMSTLKAQQPKQGKGKEQQGNKSGKQALALAFHRKVSEMGRGESNKCW